MLVLFISRLCFWARLLVWVLCACMSVCVCVCVQPRLKAFKWEWERVWIPGMTSLSMMSFLQGDFGACDRSGEVTLSLHGNWQWNSRSALQIEPCQISQPIREPELTLSKHVTNLIENETNYRIHFGREIHYLFIYHLLHYLPWALCVFVHYIACC